MKVFGNTITQVLDFVCDSKAERIEELIDTEGPECFHSNETGLWEACISGDIENIHSFFDWTLQCR